MVLWKQVYPKGIGPAQQDKQGFIMLNTDVETESW